jgi:selenocysteine lyase/cysteine desulfurase
VINENDHQHIFSLTGEASDLEKLEKQNILASLRGGRIRVGFQYFNTEKDLAHLLKVLIG